MHTAPAFSCKEEKEAKAALLPPEGFTVVKFASRACVVVTNKGDQGLKGRGHKMQIFPVRRREHPE